MNKAKIISMINYKGGVGKTTSTFNLACGLSFLASKKVLMIDLDPQCSLTNTCLESYKRKNNKYDFDITCLDIDQTINHVFKEYLKDARLRRGVNIDLDRLILKNFYKGDGSKDYEIDLIPATMFDYSNQKYAMGLDDLQIEIASNITGTTTNLFHATFLSQFFCDFGIDKMYDFIIFDCPPANNITTQNALVVSDYILIPTIMDSMSSNGIIHLYNLINETIFGKLNESYNHEKNEYKDIEQTEYFNYIRKGAPKLLGIFETLRKPSVNVDNIKLRIEKNEKLKDKYFKEITIYNLVEVSKKIGNGLSVFSKGEINTTSQNRPDFEYAKLVVKVLQGTDTDFNIDDLNYIYKNSYM